MSRFTPKLNTQPTPEFFSPDVVAARRFYVDLRPPRRQRLTVVCGGVETCNPDYTIQRAAFPFYSIEYVARGCGQLHLKGHAHELHTGLLFSYGPSVPHHITGDAHDALVKYFVDFAGTGAVELLRPVGCRPVKSHGFFHRTLCPPCLMN